MNYINERMSNEIIADRNLIGVRGDIDKWEYYLPRVGPLDEKIGIVINVFIDDDGYLRTNLYYVPEEHVDRNDWHSDMIDITHEREDA